MFTATDRPAEAVVRTWEVLFLLLKNDHLQVSFFSEVRKDRYYP